MTERPGRRDVRIEAEVTDGVPEGHPVRLEIEGREAEVRVWRRDEAAGVPEGALEVPEVGWLIIRAVADADGPL
jgi:hypothetical protein